MQRNNATFKEIFDHVNKHSKLRGYTVLTGTDRSHTNHESLLKDVIEGRIEGKPSRESKRILMIFQLNQEDTLLDHLIICHQTNKNYLEMKLIN